MRYKSYSLDNNAKVYYYSGKRKQTCDARVGLLSVDKNTPYAPYYLIPDKCNIGGKLKVKGQKKKTLTPPVSQYKEVLGKRMKIYKKPDSRKEYVKYKGELVPLVEYKNLIKHKK